MCTWYEDLQAEIDEDVNTEVYLDELKVKLKLKECGYNPSTYKRVIDRGNELGLSMSDTLTRINKKR